MASTSVIGASFFAQALLNAPDALRKKALRDRAVFATVLGCGVWEADLSFIIRTQTRSL
jgi:hypothetical protein